MGKNFGRFKGKVILITGACGSLGQDQARSLVEEGGQVILADVSGTINGKPVQRLKHFKSCGLFATLDVAKQSAWEEVLELVRRKFGALHVLLNNAGIISRTRMGEITVKEWKRVLDVNLMGPMLGIRTVAPLMRDSGGGAIVNIGSTAGVVAHPGVAYTSSKWGLRGMTVCAAMEYLDWGIRVNAVHPAQVSNGSWTSPPATGYTLANKRVMPMKRAARPQEITQAVLFLASDAASYITGTDLIVDGGATSFGLARIRTTMEREQN